MDITKLTLSFSGPLSFSGKGRTPKYGTSYTPRELFVARFYCRMALTGANLLEAEQLTQEELDANSSLTEIYESVCAKNNGFKDIAHAIRGSYREFESIQLRYEDTRNDWPKIDAVGNRIARDPSSINVLFRKSIKGLVNKELRDQIFKPN